MEVIRFFSFNKDNLTGMVFPGTIEKLHRIIIKTVFGFQVSENNFYTRIPEFKLFMFKLHREIL